MNEPTLMLHCGASLVERAEVLATATPAPTSTWFPLAHGRLVESVQSSLVAAGYEISSEQHALTKEGARYFGIFGLKNTRADNDYGWVVGMRNSHDKSFPSALCTGMKVFACDNLSFNGDVKVSRKHTRFCERDLGNLIMGAVGKLHDKFRTNDDRIEYYRGTNLTEVEVHDLLIRAIDARAITPSQVQAVLEEWRRPSHEEFADRTIWSLQNAFTEIYKSAQFDTVLKRSHALHGLLDAAAGFSAKLEVAPVIDLVDEAVFVQ